MMDYMFWIPIFKYHVNDWERKKVAINSILEPYHLQNPSCEGDTRQDFLVNKGKANYLDEIMLSIHDEFSKFVLDIGGNVGDATVVGMWHEISNKHASHVPHNHGGIHYGATLYLNFVKGEHKPTRFYSPFNNLLNGDGLAYMDETIEEGDLIFFPASILHEAPTNYSDIPREIIAMNIMMDGLVDKDDIANPTLQ